MKVKQILMSSQLGLQRVDTSWLFPLLNILCWLCLIDIAHLSNITLINRKKTINIISSTLMMIAKYCRHCSLASIHKSFNYNLPVYKINHNKSMDRASLEQTLRKSREVEEKYKKFLLEKQQSDKQWQETEAKINRTLNKLSETKEAIQHIDKLYQNYQKSFENAINSALQKLAGQKLIQVADPDFVPKNATPKQISKLIGQKKKIVFMTGAGVSAASGIPTFRDKDGYWTKKKLEGITPQQFLTFRNFEKDPFLMWDWLQDFYCTKQKCKPNIGHVGIDVICNKLLKNKAEVCIVTQNIDNFHVESTSKQKSAKKYPIYEVHGNIQYVRCDNCSKDQPKMVCFPYTDYRNSIKQKKVPKCPKCNQDLRPHIMFFDQFYEQKYHHSDSVKQFVASSDLLIVIGTALQTGLARLTVQSYLSRKVDIIQINTECTIRQKNVTWMQGKSDEILNQISKQM